MKKVNYTIMFVIPFGGIDRLCIPIVYSFEQQKNIFRLIPYDVLKANITMLDMIMLL